MRLRPLLLAILAKSSTCLSRRRLIGTARGNIAVFNGYWMCGVKCQNADCLAFNRFKRHETFAGRLLVTLARADYAIAAFWQSLVDC